MTGRPLSAVLARLIGLCMAPMVLLAVWLAFNHVQELNANQLREAGNLARNFATANDRYLDARLKSLSVLAASPLAEEPRNWRDMYRLAQAFQANFGTHVIFADEQRQMLFNTRQPLGTALPQMPSPRGRSAAVLALQTGKPQVGDIVYGPVAKAPLLAIAVPVLREGQPPRLLLTALEAGLFQSRIEQFALPEGWALRLLDGTGTVIAQRAPAGFDTLRDVADDHRVTLRSDVSAWSVVLEIPRAVDAANRHAAMRSFTGAVLLALGLGLAGSLLASRHISRQVATLGEPGGGLAEPDIREVAAARQRITQAAADLRASQERLQLWGEAFRRAEVGVVISDAQTETLVAVNAAFARQRGYAEDELVGKPIPDLFPPDRRHLLPGVTKTLQAQGHLAFESEHQRQDGSRFPVLVDLTVLRDAQGRAVHRLGFVQDISDRKRAEQALTARQATELDQQRNARVAALNLMDDAQAARREAEAAAAELRNLSMAVEQSTESIEITDLAGNITYVNDSFLRQTGYSREEVIGRNPRILQSGHTPETSYQAMWAALNNGQTWRGEFNNRRKDGSEYVEFATISPIRQPDGTVTHFVAVKEDITDRKRMSAELDGHRHHLEHLVAERTLELELARSQAESANRAKSTFLASMSHEIRTPLNAVLGFTHLLRRDATSSRDAQRLDKVDAAAKHLLAVISDILDLSKIEAGKVELESHDFAVDAVLGHVATLIGDSAAAKGLCVHVDIDHVPHWLRGDLTRLRQALLNFAGNAVKFTRHGSITLRSRLLATADNRCLVRFEVQDTGIGIAADVLPRLFQAFHQGDSSTTRKFGGTGLGLAITRQLAQMMGGDAGAQSEPGQGSCFWFTAWLERGVPTQCPDHNANVDAIVLRSRHEGARILLVEDNPVNLEVATAILQDAGLCVETAENGRVALAMMQARPSELVLMDMLMPEMDGLQATRAIRLLPTGGQVPIIAMTANAFEEDRQACEAAGMNDFIAKPVDPRALYAAVDHWLTTAARAKTPCPATADARPVRASDPVDDRTATVLAALAGAGGVNIQQGLRALNGRPDKLVSLLHLLGTTHRGDMERLRACLQRGAQGEAEGMAHAIRGAAASLGATALADATRSLETRLSEVPGLEFADIADLAATVTQELERLLSLVQAPALPAAAHQQDNAALAAPIVLRPATPKVSCRPPPPGATHHADC